MRIRIITTLILGAWLGAMLAGCSDNSTTPAGGFTLSKLGSTPDTLTVGGRDYVLHATLWRDFMPISPPDGKPLNVVVRFVALDGEPIPAGTELTSLWVVNGIMVWNTSDLKPGATTPDSEIERVAGGGPKWGPDIRVDVLVEVPFDDESTYKVQVRDQEITATQ